MGGSQKNLLDIVYYGRDLYCKKNPAAINRWPHSYSACLQILKKAGYNDPVVHYICLDPSHPHQWSSSENPESPCQYCKKPGNIKYYYLSVADKVKRWCVSKKFCAKMAAHWEHHDEWINREPGSHASSLCEIWDGERFSRLSWFWDPTQQWLLPTRCTLCSKVISSDCVSSLLTEDVHSPVTIHCPYCHNLFSCSPQYAHGDPRNIALIGHWDGWQPFSTSIKHSCGMSS